MNSSNLPTQTLKYARPYNSQKQPFFARHLMCVHTFSLILSISLLFLNSVGFVNEKIKGIQMKLTRIMYLIKGVREAVLIYTVWLKIYNAKHLSKNTQKVYQHQSKKYFVLFIIDFIVNSKNYKKKMDTFLWIKFYALFNCKYYTIIKGLNRIFFYFKRSFLLEISMKIFFSEFLL